jgi:hypothetical protein
MGGACNTNEGEEERVWVIRGGKRPLGRTRPRWADNIRMDLGEKGLAGGIDLVSLAQVKGKWRALVNAVMNLWVP